MATQQATATNLDLELAEFVSQYYADPYGFVMGCYPWGEPGPLRDYAGPDLWQREFLEQLGHEVARRGFNGFDPVAPIRMATASGHGVGKSTVCAWILNWILSTRPHSIGTVTANTYTQLSSKTWAAVQKWTALCLTARWFHASNDRIYHIAHPATWFATAQTCKEENSESFAGQHSANATSFYLFDESSSIPAKIWEVSAGGLTDGEPMHFAFGNPTRRDGAFYAACFGADRERWISRSIDSRTASFTNKELIREWQEQYGEDSDFFRVRVRGLPPRAGDLQFVDADRVYQAQNRALSGFRDDPVVLGCDVSRGGQAWSVIRFRKGLDARSIPPIRLTGEESRDTMRLATVLMEAVDREYNGQKVHTAFVDSGFGGPLVDRCHQLGFRNVVEVSFGAKPPDLHFANMRSYMWSKMRDWLEHGAIDKDQRLEIDLTGPGYFHNKQDQLTLEGKDSMAKRGLASPDDGDALALTFAQPVRPKPQHIRPIRAESKEWCWG
jgi:hypothetical protein